MTAPKTATSAGFSISSSIADDASHPSSAPSAYEWWYFDALSDDGSEAVVVIFLDNFIFSPRYNRRAQKSVSETGKRFFQKNSPQETGESAKKIEPVPAVAFVYYRNGKPIYRAINESSPDKFFADENAPHAAIGESSFKFESAPYGSGYSLSVKADLPRRRRLEARLEWLSLECDLLPAEADKFLDSGAHCWNLVAPRADVTGSIKVVDRKDKILDVRHFRGTGYHDHNFDSRWLPATVDCWQWGRAHFQDTTVVFYRYHELGQELPLTKLLLVKNNKLRIYDAFYEESKKSFSVFGLKFPKQIVITTEEGIELRVNQQKTIDDSFFYLRFLSETKLKSPGAETIEAFAITEYLAPRALKYRWLDWLVNMRIGRGGKGSFL